MLAYRSLARRLITAAGLTAAVFGAAALGGPAANAQPTPPSVVRTTQVVLPVISPLQVQAGGTEATVSFTTSVPTAITYENKPSLAAAAASPVVPAAATAGPLVPNTAAASPPVTSFGARPFILQEVAGAHIYRQYATTHQLKLTGLKSNTEYDLSVVAETQAGERLTARTSYATPKKRARITLESITITDDGDGWLSGNGEPRWNVKQIFDGVSNPSPYNDGALCYPNDHGRCKYGYFGTGTFTPRNSMGGALLIVYAEENFDRFPGTISLRVWANEDDDSGVLPTIVECVTGGCPVGEDAVQHDWRVPQGVETFSQRITLRGDDSSTGFESKLTFLLEVSHDNLSYPTALRNYPFNSWYR